MAQCPGCNKFAALETEEPEVESLDIDQEGRITGTIRLVRVSACCGYEMKAAEFDVDVEAPDNVVEHIEQHEALGTPCELEVEEEGFDVTERMGTVDRNGKPIKNPRYMKTYIGFTGSFHITCSAEGCEKFSASVGIEEEEQAGAFEELT